MNFGFEWVCWSESHGIVSVFFFFVFNTMDRRHVIMKCASKNSTYGCIYNSCTRKREKKSPDLAMRKCQDFHACNTCGIKWNADVICLVMLMQLFIEFNFWRKKKSGASFYHATFYINKSIYRTYFATELQIARIFPWALAFTQPPIKPYIQLLALYHPQFQQICISLTLPWYT